MDGRDQNIIIFLRHDIRFGGGGTYEAFRSMVLIFYEVLRISFFPKRGIIRH
jgi:hypothetical protein